MQSWAKLSLKAYTIDSHLKQELNSLQQMKRILGLDLH